MATSHENWPCGAAAEVDAPVEFAAEMAGYPGSLRQTTADADSAVTSCGAPKGTAVDFGAQYLLYRGVALKKPPVPVYPPLGPPFVLASVHRAFAH